MKILFVLPAFYPALDFGGPIPVAMNFAKRLIERGHEVTVWTTNLVTRDSKLGKKTEEREVEGMRVVYLNSVARYHWVGISPDVFGYARRELSEYDVVHIYGYREFLTLVVAGWARWSGKPYVMQALGTVPRIRRSRSKKLVFDVLFGKSILHGAAALIAKTPADRAPYLSAGIPEEKVVLIPNGMDLPPEADRTKKGDFRRKYGIGSEETLFLFLGRMDPNKGVGLLIRAFARLRNGSRLAIVGPDESNGEFERLAASKGLGGAVVFTGPLYAEDKWAAYSDADVYVLPSVRENFGMTVLEAMSRDTPVVLTEGCGIAPQVEGRAGLVVPYEEGALTEALRNLASDPGLRTKLTDGGRRLLREEFSWGPLVEQLEDLYERVVASFREVG